MIHIIYDSVNGDMVSDVNIYAIISTMVQNFSLYTEQIRSFSSIACFNAIFTVVVKRLIAPEYVKFTIVDSDGTETNITFQAGSK